MTQWLGQLHGRYGLALATEVVYVVLAVVAAIAYVVLARRAPAWKLPKWAPTAALSAMCVFALVWAWDLRWLSDDAFISFHYARNWVEGNGLVFNIGERVEGYTNFLWVVILAMFHLVGADIPTMAVLLCLVSQIGVVLMTARLARLLAPEGTPVVVSLAALALACSYLIASYGTGGLETMFGALLVLSALDFARRTKPLAAGLCGIAATMAHPDHAIFYVALGGVLLFRRTAFRQLLWYAAPFVVVFVPYFLIRWNYYGLPLPNTYYTKSGGAAYFDQGFFYVYASALGSGVIGTLPLVVYGAIARRRDLVVQFAIVAVPLYLFYVAKVGGDFMFGRLLIPVLPLLFLLGEIGVRTMIAERRWRLAASLLVLASLALVPTRVLRFQEKKWHLTDERTIYMLDELSPLKMKGNIARRVTQLGKYFGNAERPPKVASYAIGMMGWMNRFSVVDLHGLIDVELSALPVKKRGRPGHERMATPAHILKKGADISSLGIYEQRYAPVTRLDLEMEGYAMTHYRADLLDPLRDRPEVKFVRFPEYIDEYLAKPHTPGEARTELHFLDRYYFKTNPDPVRRAKVSALTAPK